MREIRTTEYNLELQKKEEREELFRQIKATEMTVQEAAEFWDMIFSE